MEMDIKIVLFFYNAILKYGFKNFKIEILGEFKIEFLDNKEKYYINLFNSLVPFGYNIYEGGASYYDKRKRTTPIKQYNLQGEFIRDYNSLIGSGGRQQNQLSSYFCCFKSQKKIS